MMLTLLDILNSADVYLKRKNIKSSRLNAELLLAYVLKCKRMDLYLSYDRPLKKNEIDLYRELLLRRSKFEPLQYIVGRIEFYGIDLEVNNSVLIPRPETELLVEEILSSYSHSIQLRILDIGCGSGNISIALAKHLPNSKLDAIDISNSAIELAKRNAQINSVANQIQFICKDAFSSFDYSAFQYDIVVSNPPYVPLKDFDELEPELKLFEPKIALTDGKDGLTFYRRISEVSSKILKPLGKLFLEIGYGQSDDVRKILLANGFKSVNVKKDYSGIERIIIGELN